MFIYLSKGLHMYGTCFISILLYKPRALKSSCALPLGKLYWLVTVLNGTIRFMLTMLIILKYTQKIKISDTDTSYLFPVVQFVVCYYEIIHKCILCMVWGYILIHPVIPPCCCSMTTRSSHYQWDTTILNGRLQYLYMTFKKKYMY